ncbi:MAG TPA: hypothetical protein VIC35_14025 [Acidimicrobiia bacterium]|jgi:hypothetical protein
MDDRRLAMYIARTRVGFGLALIVAPRAALRPWFGSMVDARIAGPLGRMTGGRDALLGAGTAIALGERNGGANWLSMLALADAVDAAVFLTAPGVRWRGRLLGAFAAASAVTHFQLARRVARADALPVGDSS